MRYFIGHSIPHISTNIHSNHSLSLVLYFVPVTDVASCMRHYTLPRHKLQTSVSYFYDV